MGYPRTHFAAATAAQASATRFLGVTNMAVGDYGAPLNSGAMPSEGARHVTVSHAAVGAADTLGTVTITGHNLVGQLISEDIVPSNGIMVTGTKWFRDVTSIVGAGWVINAGNDTISVGCAAVAIAVEGAGNLHAVIVNTTAAGTVTLADAAGTIGVLKASIAEHNYVYDVAFSGFLSVVLAAASDITVVHSGSLPTSYAMA